MEHTTEEYDRLWEEAYEAACELDSPNSPSFESVWNHQLIIRDIES